MKSRVRIIKRSTLELRQSPEVDHKNTTASNDRQMVRVVTCKTIGYGVVLLLEGEVPIQVL